MNIFQDLKEIAKKQDFDSIISKTIKNNRKYLGGYQSVKQIWEQEKSSTGKALRLIAHLEEKQMDVHELEDVLKEIFEGDVNVLQNVGSNERSDIRKLFMYSSLLENSRYAGMKSIIFFIQMEQFSQIVLTEYYSK